MMNKPFWHPKESNEEAIDWEMRNVLQSNLKKLVRFRFFFQNFIPNSGVDILTNLARDRETINRSRARVRDTEMNLSSSSRILSGMLRRAMQNRIILFGLIGALIFFIFLMIYMHFRSWKTINIHLINSTQKLKMFTTVPLFQFYNSVPTTRQSISSN